MGVTAPELSQDKEMHVTASRPGTARYPTLLPRAITVLMSVSCFVSFTEVESYATSGVCCTVFHCLNVPQFISPFYCVWVWAETVRNSVATDTLV